MDDVQVALKKADGHLTMIGALYGADLELQRLSPTLRTKVKVFLETSRSALDQLAERVVTATGAGEAHVHYPLAADAAKFDASIAKNMPGVQDARPDLAAVIASHQPYGVPALARLRELLVQEERQRLTPKTRPAPQEAEAPPASAEAPSPPPPTGLGAGLTGSVFINGVEYDPVTLQPLNPMPLARRETVYEDWLFVLDGGEVSALGTLEAIRAAVAAAIDEVTLAAGLG